MSERILNLMDIREILIHIRAGSSNRQIQRDTQLDRRTVRRYRQWAGEQGLLEGSLPPLEELQALAARTLPENPPPQNTSSAAPHRDQIEQWLKEKVEVAAMCQRLQERGYTGSYAAV